MFDSKQVASGFKWTSPLIAIRDRIWGLILSIRFCLSMVKAKPEQEPSQPGKTLEWLINNQNMTVDIDFPKRKPKGTILLIHGMNALGARDPRMLCVKAILTKMGFITVAPTIPSIAACTMTPEQSDEIRALIDHTITDTSLCPKGKVSIFTVSFSVGISVRAAARSQFAPRVRSILSIGILFSGVDLVKDILSPTCEDTYAHLIGIRYMYRHCKIVDEPLDQALTAAILDEFQYLPNDHLSQVWASLPQTEVKRVQPIITSILERQFILPKAVEDRVDFETLKAHFDFVHLLNDAPFKLYAVQAKNDPILLTKHVHRLQEYIAAHRLRHHIAITPLLDHANVSVSIRQIPSLLNMIYTFGRFFDKALD